MHFFCFNLKSCGLPISFVDLISTRYLYLVTKKKRISNPGYGELKVCFQPIRIGEIFWMNNNWTYPRKKIFLCKKKIRRKNKRKKTTFIRALVHCSYSCIQSHLITSLIHSPGMSFKTYKYSSFSRPLNVSSVIIWILLYSRNLSFKKKCIYIFYITYITQCNRIKIK